MQHAVIAFGLVCTTLLPIQAIQSQAPSAKPSRDSSLFERGELTGNWGGLRTQWKDKGFDVSSSVSQFYQGVASGGIKTGSEYNGVAQLRFDFDLGKLAGWKYWSAEMEAELRFGGPLLGGTGTISPVNTAVIIPATEGTEIAITSLNVTKLIPVNLKKGELVAVSFGRYNLLELIDQHFYAGGGTERFFNIAQIGPLTVARQIPLITSALSLAYIRGGEPIVTFSVLDPNDHSVDPGLSDMFSDGVSFSPGINFPVKYFGKDAMHSIGGAITTKEATPFDAIRQAIITAIIPNAPINPVTPQRGSWSAYYNYSMYVVERSKGDGWGFFSQLSTADKKTSPITTFFDLGFGGNGLFNARHQDEFGLAYAYTDLSSELKDNLDLTSLTNRLRAEHQVELFYNLHVTPWLQLTGDLQVIRPNRPSADTAIIPGGRLRIVF